VLEGRCMQVMQVINDVMNIYTAIAANEWITNIRMQIRSNDDMTAEEKIQKSK
jgi:uncharacterized protein YqgV (UPF0045/DUF77 family)